LNGVFVSNLEKELPACSICGVVYQTTHEYPSKQALWSYLEQQGLRIGFPDLIDHCRHLATIAERLQLGYEQPVTILFDALEESNQFIHFTSYGITHQLIGALKLASRNVQVCGVVSLKASDNNWDTTRSELEDTNGEFPGFRVKVVEADKNQDFPHQKVMVIDGLLAFKGSTNLTISAWRKSARRLDLLEVVTNTNEVIALNNKYFSPVWADEGIPTITMGEDLPEFGDEPPF
jgi:hypothetical protein